MDVFCCIVNFFYNIFVGFCMGMFFKSFFGVQWDMWYGKREIDKKGRWIVLLYKVNSCLCIQFGEQGLIGVYVQGIIVGEQGNIWLFGWDYIIVVWQAYVGIEFIL